LGLLLQTRVVYQSTKSSVPRTRHRVHIHAFEKPRRSSETLGVFDPVSRTQCHLPCSGSFPWRKHIVASGHVARESSPAHEARLPGLDQRRFTLRLPLRTFQVRASHQQMRSLPDPDGMTKLSEIAVIWHAENTSTHYLPRIKIPRNSCSGTIGCHVSECQTACTHDLRSVR